ncbi:2-C-methyl-D-erythritol 4-phosphate cytidylyltransferase [Pigmentiphaga aceris]|uniref:2-C-methyl-D-erythritol 4-phosphate cytidylyltransferase n=2 Tax=Pigmentiphaga aceris TaxID=1940612 RepID=A0A5C0B3M7_9BURK|nr:2-C-methyl-D-erythritol 4-phosphate cytidylyltransferase [Pigmentiphaga aceris]
MIAIVPAAGVGARAAQDTGTASPIPKQYRLLHGQPMLRHAVAALLAERRIARVIVAVSPSDAWVDTALSGLPRTDVFACGGPTRAETVQAALRASGCTEHDWVLVHDAARPGLPLAALQRLIDACVRSGTGGLLAIPVADTIKLQDNDPSPADDDMPQLRRVAQTVPRAGLWQAQTPQMFQAGVLRRAFAEAILAGVDMTDEASAVEALGQPPLLVQGSPRNFKVTWPEDFDLMERWMS